jgi:hypothetical protein
MYPSKKILLSFITAIYINQIHASSCGHYLLLGYQRSNCSSLITSESEVWYPLSSAVNNTNGSRKTLDWQGLEVSQKAEVRSMRFVYNIPAMELTNPSAVPTGCNAMHLEIYDSLNKSIGYVRMNTSQTDTCHYFNSAIAVSYSSVEISSSCTKVGHL